MSYSLFIQRRAQKQLEDVPVEIYEQLCKEIRDLAHNPRPYGCKKLVARPGWRIAVRKFRVIYEIDDRQKKVTVLDVDHRKDIYR